MRVRSLTFFLGLLAVSAYCRVNGGNAPKHHALYPGHGHTSVLEATITSVTGLESNSFAETTFVESIEIAVSGVVLNRSWVDKTKLDVTDRELLLRGAGLSAVRPSFDGSSSPKTSDSKAGARQREGPLGQEPAAGRPLGLARCLGASTGRRWTRQYTAALERASSSKSTDSTRLLPTF